LTHSSRWQVCNHGMSQADIDAAFAASERFFALSDEVKGETPFGGWNGGWENGRQARGHKRASTGARDPTARAVPTP
jgi:isopenicillin N synthase-like dioxygenase